MTPFSTTHQSSHTKTHRGHRKTARVPPRPSFLIPPRSSMTAVQSERFKRKHRNVVPNRTGRRHPLRNVSGPPVSWGDKGHRYRGPRTICSRVTIGALLNLKRPSLFAEQVSLPRTHVAWQRYGTRGTLCHVRASKKGPQPSLDFSPSFICLSIRCFLPGVFAPKTVFGGIEFYDETYCER